MISRVLRSAAVCLLLLIFMAGSTGISFYIHTCGSSHKKEALLFREIFHQKVSCCCDADENTTLPGSPSSTLNDGDCCKISHLFIKAPFVGFPVIEKVSLTQFYSVEYPGFALLFSLRVQDSKASFTPFRDPSPPPLSGIHLVYYLHQVRIPEPAC